MRRYTAEQLSRILGEQCAGYLWCGGATPENPRLVCLEQAALNLDARQMPNAANAHWFDHKFRARWSPTHLLAKLCEWRMVV